ncbi:MAG: alpha/beta fold hydrolase, partial [Flammeovirgaceae bacterium]
MAFVYHRQQGVGPALLLLHGFCETHQIWNDLLPDLAKHFEVLTPDLPGFGKSDPLQSNFSISDVSDTMLQWLRSVGTVPAVVIG